MIAPRVSPSHHVSQTASAVGPRAEAGNDHGDGANRRGDRRRAGRDDDKTQDVSGRIEHRGTAREANGQPRAGEGFQRVADGNHQRRRRRSPS